MRSLAAIAALCLFCINTGSAARSPKADLWGPPEAKKHARSAFAAKKARNYVAAQHAFDQGRAVCVRRGLLGPAVLYTMGSASSRFAAGQLRAAASLYLEAERHAEEAGDFESLAAIRGNLAAIYRECHEYEAAVRIAEAGLRDLSRRDPSGPATLRLMLLLAGVYTQTAQSDKAGPLYEQVLAGAVARGDNELELAARDEYATDRLRAGDAAAAERYILEGFRQRRLLFPNDLVVSYSLLSDLNLYRGDLQSASLFADRALAAAPVAALPLYPIYYLRGKIAAALGNDAGALREFRTALWFADVWRGEVLPADGVRIGANAALQVIFRDTIETALRLYDRTGLSEYAHVAWATMEENRAASLRDSISSPWRDRLSPQYFEKLGTLRQALLEGLRQQDSDPVRMSRVRDLQVELLSMETEAGLGHSPAPDLSDGVSPVLLPKKGENIPARGALLHFQRSLGESRALVTFQLGDRESYRWVVTSRDFSFARLAPRKELTGLAGQFETAVREGRGSAVELGRKLHDALFGNLPRSADAAPDWLLAPDDSLYSVPFNALVLETRPGRRPVYLVDRHAVEMVPGAWAVGSKYPAQGGIFAGIADAVYNRADARLPRNSVAAKVRATVDAAAIQFPRLPASAAEVEACARAYSPESAAVVRGMEASRDGLRRLLANGPSVLHIAAHVAPQSLGTEPVILLSGSEPGRVDALTMRDIAAMRVPECMVVMSGCGSWRGRALPGEGLLGLSRAWLAAGARAVVASHWPVPDDQGALFLAFYRHLRAPGRRTPAAALRQARLELLEQGGPNAEARYWAAYELVARSN